MYPLSPLSLSIQGFPNGSVVNNLPAMQETQVQSLDKMIPWRGNGNPLQYSCLKNPMDRGAWRVTVQRVTELGPTERLSTSTHCHYDHHLLSIYLSLYLSSSFSLPICRSIIIIINNRTTPIYPPIYHYCDHHLLSIYLPSIHLVNLKLVSFPSTPLP